ncbi:hypothetical protein OFN73_04875 [Campylobacter sp. JMF_14 EL1]|nr:hypothetical protein [Campylobacter sp. JMF_14 EL1]
MQIIFGNKFPLFMRLNESGQCLKLALACEKIKSKIWINLTKFRRNFA